MLVYQHRLELADEADSLRAANRWITWDLEAALARRPRWYQSPAVVVPLTVLLTILAVDVVVGR